MFRHLLALLPLSIAAGAYADTAPVPQPLAPSAQVNNPGAKIAAPRRLPAPAISVSRATRQSDGSLSIDCVQRPNPKLRLPGGPVSPQNGGVQP